ncbi:ABC transporter permease [Tissierella creatinophila]|uniref:ABC transporter permease n=1 Tax=Tissierella creatinophila TaxID=79681 RepID=UPI001E52E9B4|nr:ABC transporter permease subunit [Tissierella creatinophila]
MKNRKLSIISKIYLIIIWILLSQTINNDVIVPSIKSTFISMIELIKDPGFLNIISSTILRTLLGFLISLFLAIILGILSSISKIVHNLMQPILKFLNSVPTIAIIVLALIWLNNEIVPIFVGFLMVFPVLYETVLQSILNIDKNIIQMAYLYRVNKIEIIKNIYIPNIFYNLSTIFNSALGINLKMVIAGEVLAQPKYSIGSKIQLERMYLNTSGVFAWIIIILFISAMFDYMVKALRYLFGINKWK